VSFETNQELGLKLPQIGMKSLPGDWFTSASINLNYQPAENDLEALPPTANGENINKMGDLLVLSKRREQLM